MNDTIREQLRALYQCGIPYAHIARLVGVDRSHISHYANGNENASFVLEMRIIEAIRQIKDDIKSIGGF